MMVHFQKTALLHTLAFCITNLINVKFIPVDPIDESKKLLGFIGF